jgi:hypothetical protein
MSVEAGQTVVAEPVRLYCCRIDLRLFELAPYDKAHPTQVV